MQLICVESLSSCGMFHVQFQGGRGDYTLLENSPKKARTLIG